MRRQEPIGELRLVPLAEIRVDARFRRDLGDIPMLAASIQDVGLLNPILLTPELTLVSGMRRLQAHRQLGREQILSRVVDIEAEAMASIEEDRARKPLTPTERYAITEALRDKIRDEAWRRRALGGKLEKAAQRGRADDLLASHVRISRPTFRKISAMVEASRENPAPYGGIVEDLDRDGKVDRHYRRFQIENSKDDPAPRFKVAVLTQSWQTLDAAALRKAITSLGLPARAKDDAILLVRTSISSLARAGELVSFAKFIWQTTLVCSDTDSDHLWLLATHGKSFQQDEAVTLLAEGCRNGSAEVVTAAEVVSDGSLLTIDFAQPLACSPN